MILKQCEICNDEFETRQNSKTVCNKKECYNQKFREWYKNHEIKKVCKFCGNEYLGTCKSLNCENCRFKKEYEKKKEILQYFCKYCNDLIKQEEVEYTFERKKLEDRDRVCNSCVLKNREKISENMKGELNHNYRFNKPIIKKETKEEMAERMKLNNPMKNKEVSQKVASTFRNKIESGEIHYKKGKEHHLYKGNRKKSFIIRSRLKNWKQKWLSFYNYKCSECDKGGKLEIHHTIPLKDIISRYTNSLESLNDEEFEKISEMIVKDHDEVEGLVLCKICHSKIDPHRKLKI
jgi:hypothetical protein